MEVEIYGAFRSGTNYVKALLELNYTVWVRTWAGGFKHAPIPALYDESGWQPRLAIGVIKDPWSWLSSMWRYASGPGSINVECGATWERFLREPIVIFSGAFAGFPRYWYRTPIDYWIAMAVACGSAATAVIRYEEALHYPEDTCARVAQALDLARTTKEFIIPESVVLRAGDRMFQKLEDCVSGHTFDRKYYETGSYMNDFSPSDIATINSLLPEGADDAFGCTRRSTCQASDPESVSE